MLNHIDTETAMAWVPNGPNSESDRLVPCNLLQRRPDVNLPVGGDGPWEVQWAPGVGGGEHAGSVPTQDGAGPWAQMLPSPAWGHVGVAGAGGRGFQRAQQC